MIKSASRPGSSISEIEIKGCQGVFFAQLDAALKLVQEGAYRPSCSGVRFILGQRFGFRQERGSSSST